jgi:hypothetical protein
VSLARLRIITFLAIAPLLGTSTVAAGSGGSAYSALGLGDLRYFPGSRSAGMGYAGLALPSAEYINWISPASWSLINHTRFEAAALYEGFRSTDGVNSRYLARLDFSGALLSIPISTDNGIVFVAGFAPYSNVNYDTYTSFTYNSPIDTLSYSLHHVGSGALNRGTVGLSWSPFGALAIGTSLNYLFGTLDHAVTQSITSGGTGGGTVTDEISLKGLNFTFGAVYSGLGRISQSLQNFSVGLTLNTRTNLHSTQVTHYLFNLEADSSEETAGRVALPFSYGIGIGYQAGERWALAADFFGQPWAHADFNGGPPEDIRNTYRIGIGFERAGNTDPSAGWFDRLAYRAGFTYNATYYSLNGTPVNEWEITAGIAFPLARESRLNVAAEYGTRGSTSGGLIQDRIFRMTFSLNIIDSWFVRYPEE